MGALDDYLHSISDLSSLEIDGAPDLADIDNATPDDFARFGTVAMAKAWDTASGQIKDATVEALKEAGRKAVKEIGWDAALGAIGDVPLVGFIAKMIVGVVDVWGQLLSASGANNEDTTRAEGQWNTINGTRPTNVDGNPGMMNDEVDFKNLKSDPWDWTGLHKIFGYANYKPRGLTPRYSFEPCLRPMTTEGMPFGLPPLLSPGGRWQVNNGVPISCGPHGPKGFLKWLGCHPSAVSKKKKNKIRKEVFSGCYTYVCPVWYPAAIVGRGSVPLPVAYGVKGDVLRNPNALLMYRQGLILTDPESNILADLERVSAMASFLVIWLSTRAPSMKFRRISKGALEGPEKTGILDPEERDGSAARFFISETGMIRVYSDYADLKELREWGFSATPGAAPMSLGDVNTIVSTTLAAMTCRAAVLRNQEVCAQLLANGIVVKLGGRNLRLTLAIVESAKAINHPDRLITLPPRAKTPEVSSSRVSLRRGRSPRGLRTGRVPMPESEFPWPLVLGGAAVAVVSSVGAVAYRTLTR